MRSNKEEKRDKTGHRKGEKTENKCRKTDEWGNRQKKKKKTSQMQNNTNQPFIYFPLWCMTRAEENKEGMLSRKYG